MENLKKNWYLILIGLATIVLGLVAVVTARRLYQIGKKPVAPTAPKPAPAVAPTCRLTFTVAAGPTATPTPIPGSCQENFTVTKKSNVTSVDTGDEITYTITILRKTEIPSAVLIVRIEEGTGPPFKYIHGSTTVIGEPEISIDPREPEPKSERFKWILSEKNGKFGPNQKLTYSYKVKVTDAQINRGSDVWNTVSIVQGGTPETGCSAQTFVHVKSTPPGPTATPTPGPTATPTPGPTATPTPTSYLAQAPTATPTSRPPAQATATPTPVELPQAGVSLPTLGAVLGGILLFVTALILAL